MDNIDAGSAFLVDPMGASPKQLSEDEYRKLGLYLAAIRNNEMAVAAEAIEWILRKVPSFDLKTEDGLLTKMLWHLIGHTDVQLRLGNEDVDGVLSDSISGTVHWITEEERKTLEQALIVLRAGGWFKEFLELRLNAITTASRPEDRFPTPLNVASSLAPYMREQGDRLDAARDMARMRPDLVMPAPEPQATTEPPVADPKPVAAAKTPAPSPRRTHARRKRAARAAA